MASKVLTAEYAFGFRMPLLALVTMECVLDAPGACTEEITSVVTVFKILELSKV